MISTAITTDLVIHTAAQESGLTEVTQAMQAWYEHPQFKPDLPILWDMRAARLAPPQEDLEEWSARNRQLINASRAGQKTAWVFANTTAAEFAVDLLGDGDWQHKVRIFNNDIEAARAWLLSTIR